MVTYTVYGSEDGLIHATHRKREAINKALDYSRSERTKRDVAREIDEQLEDYWHFIIRLGDGRTEAELGVWDSK